MSSNWKEVDIDAAAEILLYAMPLAVKTGVFCRQMRLMKDAGAYNYCIAHCHKGKKADKECIKAFIKYKMQCIETGGGSGLEGGDQ